MPVTCICVVACTRTSRLFFLLSFCNGVRAVPASGGRLSGLRGLRSLPTLIPGLRPSYTLSNMQRLPMRCASLRCRAAMFGATPFPRRIAAGPIHVRASLIAPTASPRNPPQTRLASSTSSSSSSQLRNAPAGLSSGVSPTDADDPHAAARPLEIPSNIPREDYATPAMYSFGIMARTLAIPPAL